MYRNNDLFSGLAAIKPSSVSGITTLTLNVVLPVGSGLPVGVGLTTGLGVGSSVGVGSGDTSGVGPAPWSALSPPFPPSPQAIICVSTSTTANSVRKRLSNFTLIFLCWSSRQAPRRHLHRFIIFCGGVETPNACSTALFVAWATQS